MELPINDSNKKYKQVEEYDQNQKEEQNMNHYSPEDKAMNQNKIKINS